MIPLEIRFLAALLGLVLAFIMNPVDRLSVLIGVSASAMMVFTLHEWIIRRTGQCPEFRWLKGNRSGWLN